MESYAHRITIYCQTIEQKEKIYNTIWNCKEKNGFKRTGQAFEKIIDEYIKRTDENSAKEI